MTAHLLENINSWSINTIRQLEEIPRTHLTKLIAGQLRACIDAHGPITKEVVGSAAKRIAHSLLGEFMRLNYHINTDTLSTQQQLTIMNSLEAKLKDLAIEVKQEFNIDANFRYYAGDKYNVDVTFTEGKPHA
jgi:hypothetical protein